MELKSKPGSLDLQDAAASTHVQKIISFLLQEPNPFLFQAILMFLRDFPNRFLPKFEQKLQGLRLLWLSHPNHSAIIPSSDINELIRTIVHMYTQDMTTLGNLRGAIVEVLTTELVSSRCKEDECGNNYYFIDDENDFESAQIDVAVLADSAQQIEGYSCKINPNKIAPKDRDDLLQLANHGQKIGFRTHVGAVSFDVSNNTRRQLKNLLCDASIKAYGADNIQELRKSPFK